LHGHDAGEIEGNDGATGTFYTKWGDTTCATGFDSLYTGYMLQGGVDNGYGGEIICSTGTRRQVYIHSTGGSYAWEDGRACALCAQPDAKFCYSKWGDTTCATGFDTLYTGYIFQSGVGSGLGGGYVCSTGTIIISIIKMVMISFVKRDFVWISLIVVLLGAGLAIAQWDSAKAMFHDSEDVKVVIDGEGDMSLQDAIDLGLLGGGSGKPNEILDEYMETGGKSEVAAAHCEGLSTDNRDCIYGAGMDRDGSEHIYCWCWNK